jgi:uncharacterized protein (TIGR03118 family)
MRAIPVLFPMRLLAGAAFATIALGGCGGHGHHATDVPQLDQKYNVDFLVADDASFGADHIDPNLVNPWGLVPGPTGYWWVADNETDKSTLYDGGGLPQSTVVSVAGGPTGVVYYAGSAFHVTDGTNVAPARFMFAGEDGRIRGWSSDVPPPTSTATFVVADRSGVGANYKGLAILGERLYAADFHNARVDIFDNTFGLLTIVGSFTPPSVPAGYAPYGIQAIGTQVFVTYAKQDALAEDEVTGAGFGYIEVFDANGAFVEEVAAGGGLNAPWGIAQAPGNFGEKSNDLLVGNFGDGRINTFFHDAGGWHTDGQMRTQPGDPIVIEGLWGLAFGNGFAGPTDVLYFTAGPVDETHGLFGRIKKPNE